MNTKILSVIGWGLASCLYLWLFSLAQNPQAASPPTILELFDSFILFSFMLLGGGLSYHYLSELITAPYKSKNSELWKSLAIKMMLLSIVMLSIPVLIIILRITIGTSLAWILSYFYFLVASALSLILAIKATKVFSKIRSPL
jgi:hypothetical protein